MNSCACALSPLIIGLLALGCSKTAVPAETKESAPVDQANLAQKQARERYVDAHFEVALAPVGTYRAGQGAEAVVKLVARAPFHVNAQYPHKFKLQPSPGLQFPATVVGKDLAKISEHEATFPVAFTPEASGVHQVTGQLAFSVCTDEQCQIEKRDLALSINVD